MSDIQIGGAKRARRGYSLDEVAIAPSRRTRDTREVSTAWSIDAYQFDLPFIAAPMDSVVSPTSAVALAGLGMPAAFNVEGLWGRYEDPLPILREIASLSGPGVTARLQEVYAKRPVDLGLVSERVSELKSTGITVIAAVSPQRTAELAPRVVAAGADMVVIRGTTVSAEHVSGDGEPLNLKEFIYELDAPVIVGGCATHQAALHLMRTGAAGVLVVAGGLEAARDAALLHGLVREEAALQPLRVAPHELLGVAVEQADQQILPVRGQRNQAAVGVDGLALEAFGEVIDHDVVQLVRRGIAPRDAQEELVGDRIHRLIAQRQRGLGLRDVALQDAQLVVGARQHLIVERHHGQ